jgi:hypothetical protein
VYWGCGRRPTRHLTDAPLYWIGLGATPLAWLAFAGARGAARRLRARSSERKADPGAEMKGRIAEADAASKGGDARAADGATARALEASAIACVGVNLRGTTGDRAREELEKAGLDDAAARDVVALYGACDAARFSPEASITTDAKARWAKARKLIKSLEHSPRGARA